MSGLWSTTHCLAHTVAKISNSKVYDLALIYWSVYLAYQVFIFCQKSILSNHFDTLFTHSHSVRSSSSVVNPVAVVALLLTSFLRLCYQRIFNKLFLEVYIQYSLVYTLKFSFKLANIIRSYDNVVGVHFLPEHSVDTWVLLINIFIPIRQTQWKW